MTIILGCIPGTESFAKDCNANGSLGYLGASRDETKSIWLSGTTAGSFELRAAKGHQTVDAWDRTHSGLHLTWSPVTSQGSGNVHRLISIENGDDCQLASTNARDPLDLSDIVDIISAKVPFEPPIWVFPDFQRPWPPETLTPEVPVQRPWPPTTITPEVPAQRPWPPTTITPEVPAQRPWPPITITPEVPVQRPWPPETITPEVPPLVQPPTNILPDRIWPPITVTPVVPPLVQPPTNILPEIPPDRVWPPTTITPEVPILTAPPTLDPLSLPVDRIWPFVPITREDRENIDPMAPAHGDATEASLDAIQTMPDVPLANDLSQETGFPLRATPMTTPARPDQTTVVYSNPVPSTDRMIQEAPSSASETKPRRTRAPASQTGSAEQARPTDPTAQPRPVVPLTEQREFLPPDRWNIWANLKATAQRDDRFKRSFETFAGSVAFGVDRKLNSDFAFGSLLTLENSQTEGFGGFYTRDQFAVEFGPYAAYRLSRHWAVDGVMTYGYLNDNVSLSSLEGDRDTHLFTASATLRGQYTLGDWHLLPKVKANFNRFFLSDFELSGNLLGSSVTLPVDNQQASLGFVSATAEFSRLFTGPDGFAFVPFIEFGANLEVIRPNDGKILTGNLTYEDTSPWSFTLRTGATALLRPNIAVKGEAGYLSLGQDELDVFEGLLRLGISF